ncbi:hypothetical protein P3X46_022054 [Hevea brasiliensis]|uniref:TIR domain-containing protein n=1 Tax=Hevea brasiliensis TaxID=3981 RepID=A0ABQ9LHG2_HEVBR|nr:hypothetical protein P3X46_022054 [Hevea brasiliensis]
MIFAGKEAASSFNPFCSSPTSISSSSSSSPSYSSSSSSSSLPEWRYDVFLSFRGLDTRHNFSDHLYTALKERGVKVFRDDKKLGKGRIITRTIFRAIEESKFSIVVFSRNYACSEWCLDELAKIIECMNEKGHVAFPIFYHVPPDDVMNQIGHYEEAFLCHQRLFKKQRVQRWRIALTEIAGISGWDVQNYRSDSKLIKSIVRKISWNLRCTSPSTGKQLVPLSSTIKEINLYLYEGLDKTYIVRICGMDGMSSTTIGRVVYDAVIRQKWELFRFQELVSEMPRECSRNIWDADRVINVIRSKRQHKKVLVLLDDLDNLELVASLLRKHGWFIQGSRIVISARTPNKTILNVLDIRFGEPQGRENLFDASFNKAEKANNSMFLDIACFLKEMDDDHITRIVQSLVSGDLQAKSGTKFLISKSLIDISDNEYLLPLQDLSKKYFSQKNLEETRSHEKFWDMAGIHRLIRFDGASSQSNGKTENEPMKGLSTDKFKIQHQNLVGNGVSGKDTSSLHNLAREPVKERENAACVVPLELRSSGISEASRQSAATLPDSQIVFGGQQLRFFMPESTKGKNIVRIPKAVVEEGIKKWDQCLVGQFLGQSADISVMLNMANGLWGKEGRIEVTKTENELYIFKFPNERTRDFVLESGPWYMANNPLVMRRWQPKMKLLELDKSKIPVWIKLMGIPMEYMTMQGLSYIASAVGKPLYVDRATASMSTIAFAKVCVEISIEDKIMEDISVMDDDGEELLVRVEYLWMPEKCIACREFGHSISTCTRFKNLIGKSDYFL